MPILNQLEVISSVAVFLHESHVAKGRPGGAGNVTLCLPRCLQHGAAGIQELLGIADSLPAAEQSADVSPSRALALICDKENASRGEALV